MNPDLESNQVTYKKLQLLVRIKYYLNVRFSLKLEKKNKLYP